MKKKFSVIILDFDGVILESTEIKKQAFGDLYMQYGKCVAKEVMEYHENNEGISRYKKIRYFHQKHLQKRLNEQELSIWANQYKKLVLHKVLKSSYVLGAENFIKKNFNYYELYIATGTPEGEIKYITHKLGIDKYFVSIYGSPKDKSSIVADIINSCGHNKQEIVMVGDSDEDYNASKENSIEFIGRIKSGGSVGFKKHSTTILDLTELESALKK